MISMIISFIAGVFIEQQYNLPNIKNVIKAVTDTYNNIQHQDSENSISDVLKKILGL